MRQCMCLFIYLSAHASIYTGLYVDKYINYFCV